MRTLGQAGSGKPRGKDSVMDMAHALIAVAVDPKGTKARLLTLEEATAESVGVRDEAAATVAEASKRETAAMAAEASARSQREALAAETLTIESRLSAERTELATERQRLSEWASELEGKDSDINLREGALRRAFDAFNEGES